MGDEICKLYYFTGSNEDKGVFMGARTWRQARNFALGHESLDGSDFIDIKGHLCKEDGKPVRTKFAGEHGADDLIAAGYTNFWWSGDCSKCGKWDEYLNPVDGKLICGNCEEDYHGELYANPVEAIRKEAE